MPAPRLIMGFRHPIAPDPVYAQQLADDTEDLHFDQPSGQTVDGARSGRTSAEPSPSAHAGNAASHTARQGSLAANLDNPIGELIASVTAAYEALDHARDVLDGINPRGGVMRNELSSLRWKTHRLLRDTKDEFR